MARMGDRRGANRVWWGNMKEGEHLEDSDIDGKIILKYFFKKWDGEAWSGLIWIRTGTGGGRL